MKADIELRGTNGRIILDGEDVSRGVRGGDLTFAVTEVPLLTLNLNVLEGATASGEVKVRIRPETHALLVQLGWTPPVAVEPPPVGSGGTAPSRPPG